MKRFLQLFVVFSVLYLACTDVYVLDDSPGLGRRFDGIGGLSAGASSPLLFNYPEEQQAQILDYLFKPNFGASLQICKVEIGGDTQSTDGTEASHMHTAGDENYMRGYEWKLMVEAKKRNPNVKLYGLPWGFPSWVGNNSGSPYSYPNLTASYITKWIMGAKKYYNLDIDYIGIWNERNYNSTYIKTLRHMLDINNLQNTQIVAPDGSWSIATAIMSDPDLAKAVDVIGAHYPGTVSSAVALQTGKPLWASEDYSTVDDLVGGGCWARLLNQNYVNGNITSTISWSLIASWYNGLPYTGCGLMTANTPWSGNYTISSPIWASAHTCQFTAPGWNYLKHGYGAGHLAQGGSYVTFISPEKKDATIVIETMSHNHSQCIRPRLAPYTVSPQTAVFELKGSLAEIEKLSLWKSHWNFVGEPSFFVKMPDIQVSNGQISLELDVDSVFTLSTTTGQSKGVTQIPAQSPFPIPYYDDFNSYASESEAAYFADQSGTFEIYDSQSPRKMVMRQVVTEAPIAWCHNANQPITIIGDFNWQDFNASVDAMIETENSIVFISARVDRAGCGVAEAGGVFFRVSSSGSWQVTYDISMFYTFNHYANLMSTLEQMESTLLQMVHCHLEFISGIGCQ
jgi:galactosylceramidase